MIQLLFIRHGATVGNLEKRYIGRTDEPLCDLGITQVEELRKHNFQADALFVSPMLRTRQTAELLFPKMSYTVVKDFTETDFGLFEGKTAEELSRCPEYQMWVDSMCLDPIPQGDSIDDFKARCCTAFETIIKRLPDHTCAVFVVHGGVIMAILEAYMRPRKSFYDYHIGNGKYIMCIYDDNTLNRFPNNTLKSPASSEFVF